MDPEEEVIEGQGVDDVEWWTGHKARVFISCGQKPGEERIAAKVRDLVRDELGFCPYLAVEVHSSQSLTGGIYQKLTTADYFLFIDFARDEIKSGGWRGSLFSNQELGIASYLDIDTIPFLQEGIPLEGILKYIQGNPIRFHSDEELLEKIPHEIRAAAWNPQSRKELEIGRDPNEYTLATVPAKDQNGRNLQAPVHYFHLTLANRHWRLLATNCIVHVTEIVAQDPKSERRPDTVEMKFKHVTSPAVAVPPRSKREFDGVLVPLGNPSRAIIGILNPVNIDSGAAVQQYTIDGPGDFELKIVAYSREFRPVRATALLHLGTKIEDVTLTLTAAPPLARRDEATKNGADGHAE